MSISREEVRHIAKLARLSFTEAEEEILSQDMSKILDYVSTLNEVDTSNVEPMTHVHDLAACSAPGFRSRAYHARGCPEECPRRRWRVFSGTKSNRVR